MLIEPQNHQVAIKGLSDENWGPTDQMVFLGEFKISKEQCDKIGYPKKDKRLEDGGARFRWKVILPKSDFEEDALAQYL